jgi:ribose transport system substrate-binding protein
MFRTLLLAGAALAIATSASAKDLKAVGVTVGSLGNPFFVASARARPTRRTGSIPTPR